MIGNTHQPSTDTHIYMKNERFDFRFLCLLVYIYILKMFFAVYNLIIVIERTRVLFIMRIKD